MPDKNDFIVDGDEEHGWTVYRRVPVSRLKSKRGAIVGHVKLLSDGTYEPSGIAAMFGYPDPSPTLGEALEAFYGLD